MKFIKLGMISLLLAFCAFGQQVPTAKAEKIDELMHLAKMDTLLKQSLEIVINQAKSSTFREMMGTRTLPPEQQKIMDEFMDKLTALLTDRVSWDKVKPIYTQLYADNFSDSELDGIIAFYKTPAGQAMVDKMPQMLSQASTQVQQLMTGIGPQLQELQREYMGKLSASAGK